MKKAFLSTIILLLLGVHLLTAQEIKVSVTVNMDQLEFEQRTQVSSLEYDLTQYINNQSFLGGEWDGDPIPVDLMIYLVGGMNNVYSAQLFITSRRILDGPEEVPAQSVALKMIDDKWRFRYGLGASLTFNPMRFDEFTSLIDYYMFLVIGFDLDTYNELAGTPAFEKAKSIVQLGATYNAPGYELYSQPGDLTRFNLVSELTNMRFYEFRSLINEYYRNGMDLIGFDREQALKNLESTIAKMAEFKRNKLTSSSVLMQVFFDTKNMEIATLFNGWKNDELFRNLKYLDPGNSILYDDAKSGKLK